MRFTLADFQVEISFREGEGNGFSLVPSFYAFQSEKPLDSATDDTDDLLFSLFVDDSLKPRREGRERIGDFDSGDSNIVVDCFSDGSYQFIIKTLSKSECALLQCDKDFLFCKCALNGSLWMRKFGLNSALMLVFAFAASRRKALLIHASLVKHQGKGYAFIAKSGTGKSTQVSNWLRYVPDCELMNDDNPIIRIIDGVPLIYGSPWSGKTPCYRQIKAPLGAVTRIVRDDHNWVEQYSPFQAFASMLPSCSSMKWDNDIYNSICDTCSDVISCTGIYALHCLPDRESAEVCRTAIVKQ